MTLLTILALLLTPITAPALDLHDDDDKKDDPEERVLRHTPDYQTLFRPAARGKLYVTLGYGHTSRFFDGDGELQDLFGQANGELTSVPLHLGGAYDVAQIRDLKIRLGADFSLAQRDLTMAGETQDGSGFGPQNASIFGELIKPNYRFRTGFFYDFKRGRAPEDDVFDNSDGAHAIMLGADVDFPRERFRVFGGFDYYVTLRARTHDEVQERRLEYAPGDIANLHAGAGVRFNDTFEAGLTLLLRLNREGQYDGTRGGDLPVTAQQQPTNQPSAVILQGGPNEFDSGYALGVVPYVNYAPLQFPIQIFLKGGVQREYQDYGFTIAGSNEIAPRWGATFGLIYEL